MERKRKSLVPLLSSLPRETGADQCPQQIKYGHSSQRPNGCPLESRSNFLAQENIANLKVCPKSFPNDSNSVPCKQTLYVNFPLSKSTSNLRRNGGPSRSTLSVASRSPIGPFAQQFIRLMACNPPLLTRLPRLE
jgi:hypothetical protein